VIKDKSVTGELGVDTDPSGKFAHDNWGRGCLKDGVEPPTLCSN